MQLAPFLVKRFLIPLIAALSLTTAVNAGLPTSKETWISLDNEPDGPQYYVNAADSKISGSKITLGMTRQQGRNERSDGYYVMSWTGKVRVDCRKFKQTIIAKTGGLLSSSRTSDITPGTIGYQIADNLCFLTGIDGYTKNALTPYWATKIIETIESKPYKKATSGPININCDSPVWKNKPRCN